MSQELFDAVRAGDLGRVAGLLKADPSVVNARNARGHSPVFIAQYHKKADVVAVLLAAEPPPELDIFDAASVGRTARVAELLDADPSRLNAYTNDGFFPLALAAFFGYADTVQLLVARGAAVTQVMRNPMGFQAIHAAVHGGSVAAARALLAHGADPKAQNGAGKSAIGMAADHNDIELLKLLKATGSTPRGTSA